MDNPTITAAADIVRKEALMWFSTIFASSSTRANLFVRSAHHVEEIENQNKTENKIVEGA